MISQENSTITARPPGTDDPRIAQVMEAYLAAQEGGDQPRLEDFLARYPELSPALAQALEGLDFIHQAARQLHSSEQHAKRTNGETAEADVEVGRALGDFRIVREVGRGGMGVVYEAEQISLGRRVALKVLPLASTLDARHLQRFKNEAQAAAFLQHQNIVPVYYVGCDRGVHYYAMQFIDGQSLAQVIDQLSWARGREGHDPQVTREYSPTSPQPCGVADSTPLPAGTEVVKAERTEKASGSGTPLSRLSRRAYFAWVARLGEHAALALEHAHQQGVLHRDIKPANLMVDGRGNVWITDFGLAHLPGDQRLTMTGDLLGTLRYMSPEQALAQRVVIDHRTDIYSLGVSLYELLTLEPAYAGHDRQELLSQIAFKEPRPPRKLDKAIPPELETIVLKAMEKAPGDRYSTAQELAEDLRRHLADEPIRARRPGVVQRVRKWGRRHKPAVMSAVALLVLTVIGLGAGSWLLWRANGQTNREKDRANQQRSRAEHSLAFAYKILDDIYMDVAQKQLSRRATLTAEDKQFLKRMLALYEQVAEEGGDTPATRLRTARAFRRIGDMENVLGDLRQAVEAYDSAIQWLDRLAAEHPGSREYRTELAETHLGKAERLASVDPRRQLYPARAGSGLVTQQWVRIATDPVPEYRIAARLFEQLSLFDGRGSHHVLNWAKCELALAWLARTRDEARTLLRHAESLIARTQFTDPADRANARRVLANCERYLGIYAVTYKEKLERFRHAVSLFEQLHADAPDDLDCTLDLEQARVFLAQLVTDRPDGGSGENENRRAVDGLVRQAVSGLEQYAKALPRVPGFSRRLECLRNQLGLLLAQERNWPEAERQYWLALELARKFEAERPQSERPCTGCVLDNLACLYLDFPEHRDPAKAVPYAQEAVKHEPDNIEFKHTLGEAYLRAGRYREALPLLLEYTANGYIYADEWFLLSIVHWKLTEKAKARCWYWLGQEWMNVNKFQTAKQRTLRDEAAILLGISHTSAPTDDANFSRDFQEMCRNIPAALPRGFTGPLDRWEPCIYSWALSNLAWSFATNADSSLRDPQRAVRLAKYAVMAMPREGEHVNTLGVAHYRAGHWKQAIATLARSMELQYEGEAYNTFFLAMAHWQLGEKEKARQWYDRAVQWTETHRYQLQARAEAAKLLGITTSSRLPGPAQAAGK